MSGKLVALEEISHCFRKVGHHFHLAIVFLEVCPINRFLVGSQSKGFFHCCSTGANFGLLQGSPGPFGKKVGECTLRDSQPRRFRKSKMESKKSHNELYCATILTPF